MARWYANWLAVGLAVKLAGWLAGKLSGWQPGRNVIKQPSCRQATGLLSCLAAKLRDWLPASLSPRHSVRLRATLASCRGTALLGRRLAQLPSCQAATLRSCWAVKLPAAGACQPAHLHVWQATKLRSYAELPSCMPTCPRAILASCPATAPLGCHVAVLPRTAPRGCQFTS